MFLLRNWNGQLRGCGSLLEIKKKVVVTGRQSLPLRGRDCCAYMVGGNLNFIYFVD